MISWFRALWNNIVRRNRLDDELDEKLSAYAELLAAEKMKSGMSSSDAYWAARREMGGVGQIRQGVRDNILTFNLDPSKSGYTGEQTESFYQRLNVDLRTMPGVSSVGFSTMPLLKGYGWQNAIVGEKTSGERIEEQPLLSEVGPDYFSTLGIPMLEGREFTEQDRGPVKYAVVNQSFAKRYLPSGDPIGKLFGLVDDNPALSKQDIHVIGVIPDTKCRDLREYPPPQALFPYFQGATFGFMNVYLRTQGIPARSKTSFANECASSTRMSRL